MQLKNEDLKQVQEFFTDLYYTNDILSLTGTNCFNYATGEVDIFLLLEVLKKNNLNIIVQYKDI